MSFRPFGEFSAIEWIGQERERILSFDHAHLSSVQADGVHDSDGERQAGVDDVEQKEERHPA